MRKAYFFCLSIIKFCAIIYSLLKKLRLSKGGLTMQNNTIIRNKIEKLMIKGKALLMFCR